VTVHAPEAIGYYRYRVIEYRYLAVLPVPIIRGLYTIHPWAPIVVIDVVLVGVALLVSVLVLHARPDGSLRGIRGSIRSRLR
jgi:signal peptidase